MKRLLTDMAANIQPPATIELTSKVAELRRKGEDILAFSIGEPDFTTPKNICDKAKEALDKGFTHYTATAGIPELKQAICDKLKRDNNVCYQPDEICVGTGAKQPLANAVFALCQAGDEVILPVPCWVSYVEIIRMSGAKVVEVPCKEESGFDLDLTAIRAAVTEKTKLILLNSPNNPTGAVYSEKALRELAALAVEKDFYILSDEVYEKLIYQGYHHFSLASVSEEVKARCLVLNGFSKTYAMTGWRIGYIAGPKAIIKAISNIQSQTTSACNSIAQYAAVEALNGPQDSVEEMRQAFLKRGQYVAERLNKMPGVSCLPAAGAFYVFPNVTGCFGRSAEGRKVENSAQLSNYLLEVGKVAMVSGSAFLMDGYLRISYATSMENLKEGMDRMERAIAKLK